MSECNCQVCIPAKWRGLSGVDASAKLVFEDGWVVTRRRVVRWASNRTLVGLVVDFLGPDLVGGDTMILHNVQSLRVLDGRATTAMQGVHR